MHTEEQIRQWAREEALKLIQEQTQTKQDTCGHWVSGTLRNGILYCDACDKALTEEDANSGAQVEERSAIEQRYVDKVL